MPEQKPKDVIMKEMDEAPLEAAKEITNLKTAADVAAWIEKWTNRAGYKRLCKSLKAYFKEKKS